MARADRLNDLQRRLLWGLGAAAAASAVVHWGLLQVWQEAAAETPGAVSRTATAMRLVRIQTTPAAAAGTARPTPQTTEKTPAHTSPPEPLAPAAEPTESDYLPRSALSAPPTAINTVLLTLPSHIQEGRYESELTLFIDASGRVRRLRFDGPPLPPELAEQARQAFMSTLFRPGRLEGERVNARIRIGIVFEADPLAKSIAPPGG
jgi:hypothetical protein